MKIFANGKISFRSFMEFYMINLKLQRVKFDHSTTLKIYVAFCSCTLTDDVFTFLLLSDSDHVQFASRN